MSFRIDANKLVDVQTAIDAKNEMGATDVFVTMRKIFKDASDAALKDAGGLGSLDVYFAEVAAIIWSAGRLYGKKKK